jgi:hypothetical protein
MMMDFVAYFGMDFISQFLSTKKSIFYYFRGVVMEIPSEISKNGENKTHPKN